MNKLNFRYVNMNTKIMVMLQSIQKSLVRASTRRLHAAWTLAYHELLQRSIQLYE